MTMTLMNVCLVIAGMAMFAAVTHIPSMPRCPFCGKTREHAHDCPTQRGK